jgi:hypothetical protein
MRHARVGLAIAMLAVDAAGPARGAGGGGGIGAPGLGDPFFPLAGNGGWASPTTAWRSTTTTPAAGSTRQPGADRHPAPGAAQGWRLHRRRALCGVPDILTDPDESIEDWVATADSAFVAGEPQGRRAGSRPTTTPRTRASRTSRSCPTRRRSSRARAPVVRRRGHCAGGQTSGCTRASPSGPSGSGASATAARRPGFLRRPGRRERPPPLASPPRRRRSQRVGTGAAERGEC